MSARKHNMKLINSVGSLKLRLSAKKTRLAPGQNALGGSSFHVCHFNRSMPSALSTYFSYSGSVEPVFILRRKYFSKAILA